MVDILDEVNDEIQQEKIANFWKENGTFIMISVVLVSSYILLRAPTLTQKSIPSLYIK